MACSPHTRRLLAATCGMDEAGRGPVFGPLIVASFSCPSDRIEEFRLMGVKDSKVVSPKTRERLYDALCERGDCLVDRVEISSQEIDRRRKAGETLNAIEAAAMCLLAERAYGEAGRKRGLHVTRLEVDSVERNGARFGERFRAWVGSEVDVVCEPGADTRFVCVGAASIIAKVERDRAVAEIAEREGCDVGSGYTSDENTKAFLRAYFRHHNRLPEYVRASWKLNLDMDLD